MGVNQGIKASSSKVDAIIQCAKRASMGVGGFHAVDMQAVLASISDSVMQPKCSFRCWSSMRQVTLLKPKVRSFKAAVM